MKSTGTRIVVHILRRLAEVIASCLSRTAHGMKLEALSYEIQAYTKFQTYHHTQEITYKFRILTAVPVFSSLII
jgi:hypothetical protein